MSKVILNALRFIETSTHLKILAIEINFLLNIDFKSGCAMQNGLDNLGNSCAENLEVIKDTGQEIPIHMSSVPSDVMSCATDKTIKINGLNNELKMLCSNSMTNGLDGVHGLDKNSYCSKTSKPTTYHDVDNEPE